MKENGDIAEILLTKEQIQGKVAELGAQISADYAGKEVLLIGVLKGAVVFFADLARTIDIPVLMDFISVSSYGASTRSSGVVRFVKDLDMSIEDRHVIIVEDIVDSGLTLNYLSENLRSRNPASLKTCCLLDKPSRRRIDIVPDYLGFVIPDKFVVGYGLDYNNHYRELPFIGVLKPEMYL